jgi:hypothetical protein
VDSSNPSKAPGTSYYGTVTGTVSSVFNFDIPASAAGKTCHVTFLFPEASTLETSSYTISGSGTLDFSQLSSGVSQSASYGSLPAVASSLGQFTVAPGNAYPIASIPCPAGPIAIEVANVPGGNTNLNFFQDYNPSPLGAYITVC